LFRPYCFLMMADGVMSAYGHIVHERFIMKGLKSSLFVIISLFCLFLAPVNAQDQPAVDIEKYTNGEDADSPPGPVLIVGDTVAWTYVVTNVGAGTLSDIVVIDDQLPDAISCPADNLVSGESMTCIANGEVQLGQYANIATVYTQLAIVTDSDPSHYFGIASATAAIDIEKFTNGEDADNPPGPNLNVGDPVTWTYVVTNIGGKVLNDIVVTDNQPVDILCPSTSLDTGHSMTCTAEDVVMEGPYANVGSVSALDPDSQEVSDSDPSHYYGEVVNEPPICKDAYPSVETLWPPNHKFVQVSILGVTDPDDDEFTITIDGIFQDEPVDALGSGRFAPDAGGIGYDTAWIRAERAGTKQCVRSCRKECDALYDKKRERTAWRQCRAACGNAQAGCGDGRVYHIDFTASDPFGGECSGEVTVGVPKSQGRGHRVPVDGGSLYDSTIPWP
jgi:uncharacterized repeat protein (TIGR01451 family)